MKHNILDIDLYTHFTSPIRRYIDIIIHRLINNSTLYSKKELIEICNNSNKLETIYKKARNETNDYL